MVRFQTLVGDSVFKTVYFGGGTPALCDLSPFLRVLQPHLTDNTEFSVELHPADVRDDLLETLKSGGVNRVSMGVESLDERTLAAMERGYSLATAQNAFQLVKKHFHNAGIDLIVGYPGDSTNEADFERLADWNLTHCSVYSLILEKTSRLGGAKNFAESRRRLPSDNEVLDKLMKIANYLAKIGLNRYEISNYARSGFECRHNLAVWRGEDYWGLGDGAAGRIGLQRTYGVWRNGQLTEEIETVSDEFDHKERLLFRLRTTDGIAATDFPDHAATLTRFCTEGLLDFRNGIYRLTPRGTEVCDSILAELL